MATRCPNVATEAEKPKRKNIPGLWIDQFRRERNSSQLLVEAQ